MKKIIFILGSIGLISLSTYAADWVQTSQKTYLDKSSIIKYNNTSRNNVYSFWAKYLYNDSEMDKYLEKRYNHKYWYLKSLVLMDCSAKERVVKSVTWYNLKGDVTYNGSTVYGDYDLQWVPIIPESIGEVEYNYVCGPSIENKLYPSLDIPPERIEEMREVWLYGEKECSDLLDREPDFWDRYGHFYNCQGEYLEKFGKDFETLYNYCTAGSMSKYTKCVENILNIN